MVTTPAKMLGVGVWDASFRPCFRRARRWDNANGKISPPPLVAERPIFTITRRFGGNWELTGEGRELSAEVCDDILKIVREALWNAARHSGAQRINVRIDFNRL